MSDLEAVRRLARPTAAALEASRRRIDDLNVYPVPDGDTGTNLALTVRAVKEALDRLEEHDRDRLAHEIARAALMGARGNSGVILSQIVRGFAEVLGKATTIDSPVLARAFRSASDAAYRAVRKPVEGTMLTVIRELAEEAEATGGRRPPGRRAAPGARPPRRGRARAHAAVPRHPASRRASSTRAARGWSSSSAGWPRP